MVLAHSELRSRMSTASNPTRCSLSQISQSTPSVARSLYRWENKDMHNETSCEIHLASEGERQEESVQLQSSSCASKNLATLLLLKPSPSHQKCFEMSTHSTITCLCSHSQPDSKLFSAESY